MNELQKQYNLDLEKLRKKERKEAREQKKRMKKFNDQRKVKEGFKCKKCKIPIWKSKSGLCWKCLYKK